jgi:hypothetical protein
MFFARAKNENRIIHELRYSLYLVKYEFPRELMVFFRRIRIKCVLTSEEWENEVKAKIENAAKTTQSFREIESR